MGYKLVDCPICGNDQWVECDDDPIRCYCGKFYFTYYKKSYYWNFKFIYNDDDDETDSIQQTVQILIMM